MNIKCFTGLRFTSVAMLLLLIGQARAVTQETEQLATVGPLGGIIFGVLFVGFCVGVVWMMVKQKQPDEKDKK